MTEDQWAGDRDDASEFQVQVMVSLAGQSDVLRLWCSVIGEHKITIGTMTKVMDCPQASTEQIVIELVKD